MRAYERAYVRECDRDRDEMFSPPVTTASSEPSGYDFQKEENAAKWKGVFVNSLPKVRLPFPSLLYLLFALCLSFFSPSPSPSPSVSFSPPLSLYLSLCFSHSCSSIRYFAFQCAVILSCPPGHYHRLSIWFFLLFAQTHSIIFHPDDFTERRLDRSMTPTDVITVACARSPRRTFQTRSRFHIAFR